MIILCPGGAYYDLSERESESMALQFLAMGYHAAVLNYSCTPALFPVALMELALSVKYVREHAKEWYVDNDKIIVLGCSAGGHLAASLGVFWNADWLAKGIGVDSSQNNLIRPNGMILCYPVITAGEYAHRGSMYNLTGGDKELLETVSLETQVSTKTPKTFIWHTFEDQGVLMENSLLMVSALRKAGVPTEFHLYPRGEHGLALANHLTEKANGAGVQEECVSWLQLVHVWIKNL